jgi:hypothetical protein
MNLERLWHGHFRLVRHFGLVRLSAVSVRRLAAAPEAGGRSCAPVRNRSRGDAGQPSARPADQTTARGCRPHRSAGTHELADDARARAASCSDRQMQRFALTPIVRLAGLRREHQPQGVDHVCTRLSARSTLAKDASDLRNRRDDPVILAGLVDDRQIKLLGHQSQDTGQRREPGWCPMARDDLRHPAIEVRASSSNGVPETVFKPIPGTGAAARWAGRTTRSARRSRLITTSNSRYSVPMASINNPAGRLYLLLTRLREADGDRPLIATWSDILGQSQDLVREHLGAVAELVTQIDAAAAEPGREQVAAPVARYRGQWLEAIFPLGRPFSEATAKVRPSDEAHEALGLVAAILEAVVPQRAIPSEEDRAGLVERLRVLVEEVTNDEQLPEEVAHLIVTRLTEIEAALHHIEIGGPEAIRRATEALMGAAVAGSAVNEKTRNAGVIKNVMAVAGSEIAGSVARRRSGDHCRARLPRTASPCGRHGWDRGRRGRGGPRAAQGGRPAALTVPVAGEGGAKIEPDLVWKLISELHTRHFKRSMP